MPAVIIGALTGSFHSTNTCNIDTDTCSNGFHFGANWTVDLATLVIGWLMRLSIVGEPRVGHMAVGIG